MTALKCFHIASTTNARLLSFFRSTQRDLNKFFGIAMPLPLVFMVSSRKDINALHGRKTEDWVIAWTSRGAIFALDPKVYRRESSHNDPRYFWNVVKHEYCHLYFEKITGANFPKWLNEGLACYLAHQVKYPPSKKLLLNVLRYHEKSDQWVYAVGYFWVKLLIEKFGKAKFMKLLHGLRPHMTQKEFSVCFRRIYGISFNRKGLMHEVAVD